VEARDLTVEMQAAFLAGGRCVWTKILSIKTGGLSEVYNLEVTPPHTFIAGGFIVHNKGGGRGNSLFYLILIAITVLRELFRQPNNTEDYNGGQGIVLRRDIFAARDKKTRAIMQSLSGRDPDLNPDAIEERVKDIFLRAQIAWQARDYSTLRGDMMPDLYAEHCDKVEAIRARGEINMMEDVRVIEIDFVQVRCPAQKEGRSFTVLITASALDYTVDANTHTRLRGDTEPAPFQEFWTFYRFNDRWALARIDQAGELDFLNSSNLPEEPQDAFISPAVSRAVFPTYSPAAAVPLAAAAAGASSPMPAEPPAPEKTAAARDGDIWDRQRMEIAATLAFENVYEAWGRNDSSILSADFASAETMARLKNIMQERRTDGFSFEFAGLFTRRAEIVLTNPSGKDKTGPDEFTARLTATALRAMRRNGKLLHRDEAPAPFTEYWVFGREDGCWKLRDILPRIDQEKGGAAAKDGAPSPVQIEWYWRAS